MLKFIFYKTIMKKVLALIVMMTFMFSNFFIPGVFADNTTEVSDVSYSNQSNTSVYFNGETFYWSWDRNNYYSIYKNSGWSSKKLTVNPTWKWGYLTPKLVFNNYLFFTEQEDSDDFSMWRVDIDWLSPAISVWKYSSVSTDWEKVYLTCVSSICNQWSAVTVLNWDFSEYASSWLVSYAYWYIVLWKAMNGKIIVSSWSDIYEVSSPQDFVDGVLNRIASLPQNMYNYTLLSSGQVGNKFYLSGESSWYGTTNYVIEFDYDSSQVSNYFQLSVSWGTGITNSVSYNALESKIIRTVFNSGFSWSAYYKIYITHLNSAPTFSWINVVDSSINLSNSWSFNLSINNVSDYNSNQLLDILYSIDGVNYTKIDNPIFYNEYIAGEYIKAWDIVRKWYKSDGSIWCIDCNVVWDIQIGWSSGGWNQIHQPLTLPEWTKSIDNISIHVKSGYRLNYHGYVEIRDSNNTVLYSQQYSPNNYSWTWRNFSPGIAVDPNEDYKLVIYNNNDSNTYEHFVSRVSTLEYWDTAYLTQENGTTVVSTWLFPAYKMDLTVEAENPNFVYKTDAKDSRKLEFIWTASHDVLEWETLKVYVWNISGFSSLTPDTKQYLSDTPWEISNIPGTNSVEFWTSSGSTNIIMNWRSYSGSIVDLSLDLSSISEGNNTLYFKVNDWEIDSSISTLIVNKDTIAPTITENTSISRYVNTVIPTYIFDSNESWTIAYSGSCSSLTDSAINWENSITFNALSEGEYSDCSLTVTDSVWNVSQELLIPTFSVDITAPTNPETVKFNGWNTYSQTREVNVEISHLNESDVSQWCMLESSDVISNCAWTNKPETFTFDSDGLKNTTLYLRDIAGNINTFSVPDSILIDTVDPIITVLSDVDSSYTNTGKTVNAMVLEDNLLAFKYEIVDSSQICDDTVYYSNSYTAWDDIVLDNELYNGKRVCFHAYDDAWRVWFASSSVIENIDMSNPEEPNFSIVTQSAWNKIRFKWTCTAETWLQFVVKNNWAEISRENLWNPCEFDFEYTLSDSQYQNDFEYYLEDVAGNKSLRNNTTVFVDASGVLVTPKSWKTVEPIITFFGFAQPNVEVKIKETENNTYIASWSTDNNGIFSIQTSTSQALGDIEFDLEVNGVMKNQPRTVTVESSSIIIPTIIEDSVYSKYSGIKDIYSFESQIISFTAKWEPLSKFKVYSYADVSWERVITEIAEGQFDSQWEALVSSNIALPGWENELVIIDKIHDVSSNIVYMVIADPFWVVYDSVTKQPIVWAKVSFCREWEKTPAILPQLHGEDQPNPVITDSEWNYFSYHEVWNRYYVCWVEADWYDFPSTKVSIWTNNLDNTPNIGSHGQVFEIIPTPLHIDIPLDKKVAIQKSSWWGGWGSSWGPSILSIHKTERNYSKVWDRQLMVLAQEGTKTSEKVSVSRYVWGVYAKDLYRLLYEKDRDGNYRGVKVNKPLTIQITDLSLNNFNVWIRYDGTKEYELFNDYDINGYTITFQAMQGFELYIENNIKSEEKIQKGINVENNEYEFHEVKYFYIDDKELQEYLLFTKKFNQKLWNKLMTIDDKIIFGKLPIIFNKIEKVKNPSKDYKYVYNALWYIYDKRKEGLK